jgi:hypothetical protein
VSDAVAVSEDYVGAATPGLLVLTDERSRFPLLGQPFRAATVWEPAGDATDVATPAGSYSAIVVDRLHLDLGWLDRVLQTALPSLAPGGRVVIAFRPAGELMPQPASPSFPTLVWEGLEAINGRVCATLRPGTSTTSVAELLVAVHSAVRLATTASADALQAGLDQARSALRQEVDERSRSERALLDHLERLASSQPGPRRSQLRAFLRRYRVARAAYALLRRIRRNEATARR